LRIDDRVTIRQTTVCQITHSRCLLQTSFSWLSSYTTQIRLG